MIEMKGSGIAQQPTDDHTYTLDASLERPDAQLVAAQRQFCRNSVHFEPRAVGLSTERDGDVGFVELKVINRDTSGEQVGEVQGDDQVLKAREISLLSGSFLNDDIFGDETLKGSTVSMPIWV